MVPAKLRWIMLCETGIAVLGIRLRVMAQKPCEIVCGPTYEWRTSIGLRWHGPNDVKNNKIDFSFIVKNNWKDTAKVNVCKTLLKPAANADVFIYLAEGKYL